jgi:hypothetical protein
MAQLHVGLVAKQRTPSAILLALEQLPNGLVDTYDGVMERISSQDEDDKTLALNVLNWITYAKRPLQSRELEHAVSVRPDGLDIDFNGVIDADYLVGICAGIVTVDEESGIIRLVHYTTQRYLEAKLPPADVHFSIARTCLTYLGFAIFAKPMETEESLENVLQKYKLGSYAAQHWGEHAREGKEADLQTAIFNTFDTQDKRDLNSQLLFEEIWTQDFSFLHMASMHGSSLACITFLDGVTNFAAFVSFLITN